MSAALNAALRDSLGDDARVLVFGEDVGALGGIFRVTDGLQAEFGDERVFDTPSAEAGIVGAAIGLALAGWRPVAELQYDGFAHPGLDQVISHLAKYRMRTRGRVSLPVVVRVPYGGGIRAKEHHGESPEVYYAHTAGLKVVTPSNAADAYPMLRAAIADPDPVIFLEPKSRYRDEGEVETPAGSGDPGALFRARVVRPGDACVVFAYGPTVKPALDAAETLEAEGFSCCVVDLRSLAPLDSETILAEARRVGRCVVVHEAPVSYGVGAEVAARIQESAFSALAAPVGRVAPIDTPYPPAALEGHWLPTPERIAEAVRLTLR
jgi:pyruvate dehydrogenase E1 component beta subunit